MNSPRLSALAACILWTYLPLAQAAVDDCAGTSPDGRATCIPPTLSPPGYSACSTTQLIVGQAFESQCAASVGFTGGANTEGQLSQGGLINPRACTPTQPQPGLHF
jgi:hypothetical protein